MSAPEVQDVATLAASIRERLATDPEYRDSVIREHGIDTSGQIAEQVTARCVEAALLAAVTQGKRETKTRYRARRAEARELAACGMVAGWEAAEADAQAHVKRTAADKAAHGKRATAAAARVTKRGAEPLADVRARDRLADTLAALAEPLTAKTPGEPFSDVSERAGTAVAALLDAYAIRRRDHWAAQHGAATGAHKEATARLADVRADLAYRRETLAEAEAEHAKRRADLEAVTGGAEAAA